MTKTKGAARVRRSTKTHRKSTTLRAMTALRRGPLRIGQIASRIRAEYFTVNSALHTLMRDGRVVRVKRGVYAAAS